MYLWSREKFEDVATGQRMPGTTRNWKARNGFSPRASRASLACRHLDFSPVIYFRFLAFKTVNKYISIFFKPPGLQYSFKITTMLYEYSHLRSCLSHILYPQTIPKILSTTTVDLHFSIQSDALSLILCTVQHYNLHTVFTIIDKNYFQTQSK